MTNLHVDPETVVRWHRRGWSLYWRWRSRHQLGRPRLSPGIRELIAAMANENRLWGTERIRGELLKLGIVVSSRSIRRYRRRRHSRPPSQSWRTFLANHSQAIWAADLFVVQTLTFQTLYVIFFVSHGSRQLVHFEVTAHPTAAWVWRQLIEATPCDHKPRYLIHDRDRVWGADFGRRGSGLAINSLRTPIQAALRELDRGTLGEDLSFAVLQRVTRTRIGSRRRRKSRFALARWRRRILRLKGLESGEST